MNSPANQLPNDVEALKALVLDLQAKQQQQHRKEQQYQKRINHLEEEIRLMLQKRFGASSEKLDIKQLGLFNEAEAPESDQEEQRDTAATQVASYQRKRGKRAPLPDFLPRIDEIHDLSAEEKVCPHDGHALHRIGEEVSEQLDVIPAKIQVIRHVRIKYGCRCCEQTVKTAPLPAQPIPKSQASAGLLAYTAVSKYVDALPLYRQVAMWSRVGVELDRTTLSNWMIKVGELLVPIYNLLQDKLLAGRVIHMDETRVQVLKEPGRRAESQSYMWVRVGGDPPQRIILFDYEPTRNSEAAKQLLEGFNGALVSDGYEGYNAAVKTHQLSHAGCWAHVRRRFDEAVKASAKNKKSRSGKAHYALAVIGKLYAIERRIANLSTEEKFETRQAQSKPLLDEFKIWLEESLPTTPPSNLLGKALNYLHNQWPKLITYLDHSGVPIDNNVAENVIRPFVLGRKNWLFSTSQAGAKSSAIIYSIIQTAKANDIEPYAYLRHTLTELPKIASTEDIEALLPLKKN